MLYMLQILPLALYLLVGLHLHIRLAPFETVLLVDRNEVVEEEGIGSFLLVFRQDADEHQVETFSLMELQGTETMPPSEGPQTSVLALLQGARHIGDRDTHADDVVVRRIPVFNETEHIHVEHGEVHLQVLVNLAFRHL